MSAQEKRQWIQSLDQHINEVVHLKGWIDTIRHLKKMWFLVIRDRTGLIQVTYEGGTHASIDQKIEQLTPESAVTVTGKVILNSFVKLRGLEVIPREIEIESLSEAQLPIDENSSAETRMDFRFLDLRRIKPTLIFRIQSFIEQCMREYWVREAFMEIHTPKLMAQPSESGAEVFRLEYYDRYAYLAQSPQFYKQMAMAAGWDRVFEIAPVFRANPSHTSRHETEFVGVDMEMSWIESHEEIMGFQEKWLEFVIRSIKETFDDDIQEELGIDIQVPRVPFPRVTMQEAHRILKKLGHELSEQEDLDAEGEQLLSQYIHETEQHEFVFVTNFPVQVRPFYHMRFENSPQTTKSYDLLWKGLEVTTGAQREHRYDVLVQQALEKGLSLESLQDYLNIFRFGCPPHGGFGTGLARLLVSLLELKNIREAVFLSRNSNRLTP